LLSATKGKEDCQLKG